MVGLDEEDLVASWLAHAGAPASTRSRTRQEERVTRSAYDRSEWWTQLLGYVDLDDNPNLLGHDECLIRDPDTGHRLLFIEVPEAKAVKNRLHFDLSPRQGTRDQEIERVRGLGATDVSDQRDRHGPGTGWLVLADPEGIEFCILRSAAELAVPSSSQE